MAPAQTLRVEVQAPKPVYVHFLTTSCACRVGQPGCMIVFIIYKILFFIFEFGAGVEPLALVSHQYGYALGFATRTRLDFDYCTEYFGFRSNSISCESYILSKDNRNGHVTVYMCYDIEINKVLPSVRYLIDASRSTTEPYGI